VTPPSTRELNAYHTDWVQIGSFVYYIDDKSNLKKSDTFSTDTNLFTLLQNRFSYRITSTPASLVCFNQNEKIEVNLITAEVSIEKVEGLVDIFFFED